MSTYMPKPGEVAANWHVVDATDQVLGRLASRVSLIIQGKHKPTYTPHVDTGDFVIVLNVGGLKVTGNKADVLEYDTYSRYPGGRPAPPPSRGAVPTSAYRSTRAARPGSASTCRTRSRPPCGR